MKAVTITTPFNLDHVQLSEVNDPGQPGRGKSESRSKPAHLTSMT